MSFVVCMKHNEAGEQCSKCADEAIQKALEEAPPDVRKDLLRTRMWDRVHIRFSITVAVLLFIAYYAFELYREYIIWTR